MTFGADLPFGAEKFAATHRNRRAKAKKGQQAGPFSILFLLPVGLADFMGADATVLSHRRQQGIFNICKK